MREWLNGSLITRQFDDTARTVTRTLAREDERDEELTSTFSYSAAGELRQVQLPDGAELTLAHDAAGREASRSGGEFLQQREYDVMVRLTRDMSGQQQERRIAEVRLNLAEYIHSSSQVKPTSHSPTP